MKIIFVIFISVLFVQTSFAQTQEQLKKANQLLANKKITEATILWNAIIAETPQNVNYNFKLGLCYYRSFDKGYKSLEYLKRAVQKTSDTFGFFDPNEGNAPIDTWFFLAEAYMLNNKPDSALQNYLIYLKKAGDNISLPVQQRITDCMNAKSYIQQTNQKQQVKSLGLINSPYSETNPIVSWDESAIYFSSRRLDSNNSNKDKIDSQGLFPQAIWVSHFKNNTWTQPEMLTISFNTNDIPLFISRNGKLFYFSRNDGANSDIYSSELSGNKWGEPIKLPFNSKANESGFTMTLDETKAWYTSDRSGGKGGSDIYSCEKTSNGWSEAMNVSELNTPLDELNPFVNTDSKTIFFSSNGYTEDRMGGFDLYASKLSPANKWSEPVNLGSPVNTTGDDLYFSRSTSDNIAYISRIAEGNSFDLFEVNGFELTDYKLLSETLKNEPVAISSDPEVTDAISQINRRKNTSEAVKLLQGMEPLEAAKVMNEIEKDMGVKVINAIEPSKAASIMNYMDVEKALAIAGNLTAEKSASIIQLLDIEKSIAVMNGIDAPKASLITEKLETAKAVEVMEGLSANSSSSIINGMEIEKAVGVMDGIEIQKATDIMQEVEIEKAIDVVGKINPEKANNIVAGLESGKATSMLESMEIEKAVEIIEGMPVEKAVDVMESFDLSKSVAVASAMDNQKASNLIENMELSKAVAVMDGVPREKAMDFIQGMEVEKAVGLMSGMDSDKSNLVVEGLQKQVNDETGNSKVVALLKKYFAGQISNKESILFKTIYFDFNSSELLLLSKNELLMLVDFLRENKIVKIEVVGHTDNVGDWDANLKVSGDRAEVVYDFLRKNKIEHDRIIFYGKGPAAPIATNDTDYGRKLNRRVEIILLQ
jgi:outer membrane protein OmpA-like peptidoglycan-associated protein